jgi:hypothetical protein
MERSELAITKLIILSIVRSLPSLTLSQLTSLALDTLYMDYFGFAAAFEGLRSDQMLIAATRPDDPERDAAGQMIVRCELTSRGRAILEALEHKIPAPVRSYLAQMSTGIRSGSRQDRQLTARYEANGEGQYRVTLRQEEREKCLVDLALTIPDEELARQICDRWLRLPQSMYLGLLALLSDEPVLQRESLPLNTPSDVYAGGRPDETSDEALGQPGTGTLPMPGEQTLL